MQAFCLQSLYSSLPHDTASREKAHAIGDDGLFWKLPLTKGSGREGRMCQMVERVWMWAEKGAASSGSTTGWFVQGGTVQQKHNVRHVCGLHFLISTFKKLLKGEINFSEIFHLIHMDKILSFRHAISIKLFMRYFIFLFLAESSTSGMYSTLYSASWFRLAMFQVLDGHMWLVAAWLDSTSLVYGLCDRNSGWQERQMKFEPLFGGSECAAETCVDSGWANSRHRI